MFARLGWVLHQTAVRFTKNDGNLLASSMAYYAAFSFFPLLLVLISALGFALQFSESAQDAKHQLLELLSQSTAPTLAEEIDSILTQISSRAVRNTPVGVVTLLFGAIGIFSMLESAFDRLWHQVTPHARGTWPAIRNALWNRLKAFLTLLGLGVLVVIAFFGNLALTAVQTWAADEVSVGPNTWHAFQITASAGLNALVFTLLYKLLPRVRVRWLHALCGGVVVAALWQVASQLVSRYIVGGNYSAYGVVGSFIAMMLWVYSASLLLFVGAQLVQVLGYPDESPTGGNP